MLMNNHDKKGIAAIIVKKIKGNNGEEKEQMESPKTNEAGDEVDNSIGLEAAAEELISAIKMEDKRAVVQSIRCLIEMLEECEEEEDGEEEGSDEPKEENEPKYE